MTGAMDFQTMRENHNKRYVAMLRKRAAGKMSTEQFWTIMDQMRRQQDRAADADQYGSGFLADLATDALQRSGLAADADLWPWIESTFNISWQSFQGSKRIQTAARIACQRVFGDQGRG